MEHGTKSDCRKLILWPRRGKIGQHLNTARFQLSDTPSCWAHSEQENSSWRWCGRSGHPKKSGSDSDSGREPQQSLRKSSAYVGTLARKRRDGDPRQAGSDNSNKFYLGLVLIKSRSPLYPRKSTSDQTWLMSVLCHSRHFRKAVIMIASSLFSTTNRRICSALRG